MTTNFETRLSANGRQSNQRQANRLFSASNLVLATALCGAVLNPSMQASAQTAASAKADVVVITGSAVPVTEDKVGNALTVLDGAQIEDQGYTYVTDALRQVPGVAISRTGPYGGLTAIRTRGSEANHTIVLFNGVDVSDPGDGQADLSTLLTSNVERIEVLRGPQSGLYGSNALAGVVNIITRKDTNGQHHKLTAEYGSNDTATVTGGAGMGDGKWYVDASLAYLKSGGYDVSELDAIYGAPGQDGDKEGYENGTAYVSGGVELSSIFRLDGFARYLTVHSELDGQAFSGPEAGLTYDDASETFRHASNIAGTGTLSLMDGKWNTVFYANYSRYHTEGKDGIPFDEYGNKSTRAKYGVQSSYKFGAPGFLSTVTGFVESKKETYENTHPFGAASTLERELLGLGAQYQAEINDQIFLSATVRHDDNDEFEASDTYSVAGSWKLPNSGTRLHASYGSGVTNPTFFEQFGFIPTSFIGNPNLNPEKATGWDLGVEQTFFNGGLVVDATYFSSVLKDEIIGCSAPNPSAPPATLSSSCNSGAKSDRDGYEVSASWYPLKDLDLVATYTHLDATGPGKVTEVRRPDNQASLDAYWRILNDKAQLNAGVTYTGDFIDTSFVTFLPTKVDANTLVRVGASYKLQPGVELYARVENVFDEKYEEVLTYRAPGRTAYIGVRFTGGNAK